MFAWVLNKCHWCHLPFSMQLSLSNDQCCPTLLGLIFAGLIFAGLIFAGLIFAILGKIAKNSPAKCFKMRQSQKLVPQKSHFSKKLFFVFYIKSGIFRGKPRSCCEPVRWTLLHQSTRCLKYIYSCNKSIIFVLYEKFTSYCGYRDFYEKLC